MSLNQSLISDFSEYYRWSQRTKKKKYKLHYGWCTGRRFTAATRHNTSYSEVKQKSEMRSFKSNENIHKKEGESYYVVSAKFSCWGVPSRGGACTALRSNCALLQLYIFSYFFVY